MGLATIIRKTKLKEREIRVLILGLDNSGKSTCLNRWLPPNAASKREEIAPTFGFEIKTVDTPTCRVVLWDIGGQKSLRPFWRTYFEDASDGLIWVIDSADTVRFNEGLAELGKQLLLAKCMVVVIIANKQDLPNAVPAAQLKEILEASLNHFKRIEWRLFAGSAISPDPNEIDEAFLWMTQAISKNKPFLC
jgi:ADP-ribosylation factor-like protein 2